MMYSGNRDLIRKARELRSSMTKAEIILWSRLRSKQLEGFKFKRQQPLLDYIVDFYCHELKLIVEVDGEVHLYPEQVAFDKRRDKILKLNGYHIFRISNQEVETNLKASLDKLKSYILTDLSPSRGTTGGDPTVCIGPTPLGNPHPIRLQSMTNTNTLDTKASVAQCIRIIEAGADFVRLAAQGVREAANLENIKSELRKAGYNTPLIADIHFNPAAAEVAARIVEKIRINPGNYADKRASFRKAELTDKEYDDELKRIHSRLMPLIKICRENNTAVRIGVNHGSLSDRIMSRYGNTPEGMAVSAMEFIRIFRNEDFHKLVISMKSSDTVVMVEATRAIVRMMAEEGFSYPIHLGVTEAGEGEDGRIRSAAGIGALLVEGIGDTIRVSLTEEPENEILVAKEILSFLTGPGGRVPVPEEKLPFKTGASIYKPEVLVNENGRFITESGKQYRGKVITFNAGSFPEIPKNSKDKIVLNAVFNENDPIKLAIDSATILGRYFILKQADGICITNTGTIQGEKLKELSFAILQATEARITRTRYISCPTCGRTRFNMQDAVKEVKAVTGHLKGLKIAVMGCIVNGPGEMAGADYGYVGTSEGKVHIYRGTVPVLKNIPQERAAEELVKLIERDLS